MSVDSYFCFCCLSTNNLTNLFSTSPNNESDYAYLLRNLCSVSVCKLHYKDDSYICEECIQRLTDAQLFKLQVLNTINILQINGLVKTKKVKGEMTFVSKAIKDYMSSDDDDVKPKMDELSVDLKEEKEFSNDHIQMDGSDVDYKPEYLDEFSEDELNENYSGKRRNEKRKKKRKASGAVKKKPKSKVNNYKQYREKLPYSLNEDLKCDICCSILPNLPTYHKHMNEHYASFFCDTCGKGFWSTIRLRKHMIIHRTEEYTCPNCKRIFKKYHTFTGHKKLCVKKDKFRYCCLYCDERFVTFHRRMIHLESVHGKAERQFKCVMCPMNFLVKSDLSVHIKRTHLKLKRIFCEICNMGFYNKENLNSHMHCHTGKKEFKCSLCPKAYTRQKALAVHMRVHTNDRRFGCDRCGKMFFQKCSLQLHMKTHEKDKLDSHDLQRLS